MESKEYCLPLKIYSFPDLLQVPKLQEDPHNSHCITEKTETVKKLITKNYFNNDRVHHRVTHFRCKDRRVVFTVNASAKAAKPYKDYNRDIM